MRPKQTVFSKIMLVGMPASAKSTTGSILARRLRYSFLDSDAFLEARFSMPVARYFLRYGEAAFRQHERRQILHWLHHETRCVIASGGGAFLDATLRRCALRRALVVWLDCPPRFLVKRLKYSDLRSRPLLETRHTLRKLYACRRVFYRRAALHIETKQKTPAQLATLIDRYAKQAAPSGHCAHTTPIATPV